MAYISVYLLYLSLFLSLSRASSYLEVVFSNLSGSLSIYFPNPALLCLKIASFHVAVTPLKK